MLKQTLALIVLSLSVSANAAIVTYNGYSLDTTTNIVSGGGLQWLQWNETAVQSINMALTTYSGDGWRLASNSEMAAMLNSFVFPITFDTDENTQQNAGEPNNSTEAGSYLQVIELFGDTCMGGCANFNPADPFQTTRAYYGEDGDGDGLFNWVGVLDDWTRADGTPVSSSVFTTLDGNGGNQQAIGVGVALVRVSPVPVPAASWLFMSAILGLIGKSRLVRR